MLDGPVDTGKVMARGVGRRFEIRTGGRRSLKEALLRRPAPETHEFWAVRDVDLDVERGETLGILGRNGSGKSTLLSLIARVYPPTEGTLAVGGTVGSLLELGAGFHPDFTGVENIQLNAAIHGLGRRYVNDHLEEIIQFAELEEFAHMPVKTYSSGMFLRLGFSVAVHVRPDVLLVDEVLAVGDKAFQERCYEKIWEFKRAGGTLLFVSHDLAAIGGLCDRVMILDHGRLVSEGQVGPTVRVYSESFARPSDAPT